MLAVAAKRNQHKAEHRYKNYYFEVLSCFVTSGEKNLSDYLVRGFEAEGKERCGRENWSLWFTDKWNNKNFLAFSPSPLQNIKPEIHIWHY